MKKLTSIIATLFILITTSIAQTTDAFTSVPAEEIPEDVINSFEKTTPNASDVEWGLSRLLYEAKFMEDGKMNYYRFTEEGQFIEKRVKMDWKKDAPKVLKDGKLKTYYKYWEVIEFYTGENPSNTFYVLQLKDEDGNLKTMYFDDEGNLDDKSNSGY